MAQRFGGPNSPGGDPRRPTARNPAESRATTTSRPGTPSGTPATGHAAAVRVRKRPVTGARSNILFLVPFLWAFSAFFRDPAGLVQHLGTFGLLMLAAWLTRDGIIAHAAYDERKIARRPAIPRKIFASIATAAGLGLAAIPGLGLVPGTVLALLGGGLHLLAFGPDPLRSKGIGGADEFQTDRVVRAVKQAEDHLSAMIAKIGQLNDRALNERMRRFADGVRPLLRAVEADPAQLGAARRYLGLYLEGAREATEKFTDLQTRTPDAEARSEYLALLDDLERNFQARLESFRTADRERLDIEVEVLRERLAREGVRPDPQTAALPAPEPLADPLQSLSRTPTRT